MTRLASAVRVGALRRLAEGAGGFATILATGDATAGAVLLQCNKNGAFLGFFEPAPGHGAHTGWIACGPTTQEKNHEIQAYIDRRRRSDPDLWVVELDVPDVERFIVGLSSVS